MIHTPRLGPLRIGLEYNLAEIRNLRLDRARKDRGELVQIRFDYGGGSTGLGDAMPRAEAALALLIILKTIADLIAHRKEHSR